MDYSNPDSQKYHIGNPVSRDMSNRAFNIEKQSFDIIECEIGKHDYSENEWNIVRRVIHATADFDFARSDKILFHKNSIDSTAETNPTGIPIIRNGLIFLVFTIEITSYKAVGAFPIMTIP